MQDIARDYFEFEGHVGLEQKSRDLRPGDASSSELRFALQVVQLQVPAHKEEKSHSANGERNANRLTTRDIEGSFSNVVTEI